MPTRSILKLSDDPEEAQSPSNPFPFSTCYRIQPQTPHVHFPPTPTIASTYDAYSPTTYDRAPIVVAPNSCALPERGGRIFTPDGGDAPISPLSPSPEIKGSYFHPRASEATGPEPDTPALVPSLLDPPPLCHDCTSASESDDLDEIASTPPHTHTSQSHSHHIIPPHLSSIHIAVPHLSSHPPIPRRQSQEDLATALSFLPYPPSQVKGYEKAPPLPPPPYRKRPSTPRGSTGKGLRIQAHRNLKPTTTSFASPTLDGCLGGF